MDAPRSEDIAIGSQTGTRALELCTIFIFMPLLISGAALIGYPAPLLPLLWVVALGSYLMWRAAEPSRTPRPPIRSDDVRRVMRRLLIGSFLLSISFAVLFPQELFHFPRARPRVWAIVILLYPLVSVVPQEFLYRTYFYARYASLFSEARTLKWANAALFALLHLVFLNWIAVALTFVGGLFFADTYERSRSLLLVSVEHTLYGWIVITLGLGSYLYFPTALSIGALFR